MRIEFRNARSDRVASLLALLSCLSPFGVPHPMLDRSRGRISGARILGVFATGRGVEVITPELKGLESAVQYPMRPPGGTYSEAIRDIPLVLRDSTKR